MRLAFLVIILSLLSAASISQQLHFRQYQLPIDFRDENITTILQTSDHYIWIGTTRGLFRFDGLDHKHFLQDTTNENSVSSIYEDKNGILWIGYKSGKIGKIKNNNFADFSPEEGFPKVPITGFAEDKNSNIWFSTYGEGAYFFYNNRLYNINSDDGLQDEFIYSLIADEQGRIWMGTDRGIAICQYVNEKKEIEVLDVSNGLPDNIVTSLAYDSSGVWIGMESRGICRYNLKKDTLDFKTKNWDYGRVTDIEPQDKQIWAGTAKKGMIEIVLPGVETRSVTTTENLLRISNIMTDNEGNIWLSTGSSSLYLTTEIFSFLKDADDYKIENVQAILSSGNGQLLYSTDNSLYSLDRSINTNGFTRNDIKLHEQDLHVISMYQDNSDIIWFGTFDKGAFAFDPHTGKKKQFTESTGLINNNVLSIAGSGDEIWFATLGGVSRYNIPNEKMINYTSQSGLGSNYIYQVYVDSQERVWFATDGKGVTMLDNGVFRNFSSADGLKNDVIYSITEDAFKNIWISTSNSGLYKFDGDNFYPYKPNNEFRDLSIASIIGDKNGNILLISKSGIDILNPESGTVFYHSTEVGITDIDPNLNAYSIDEKGDIWIGTQTGIIKYHPMDMRLWPVTRINEMQVFLNPYEEDKASLSYDQNHISFAYKGFWYHEPEEVTYHVKLEGYDREWVKSRNNFITYPNLPPGDYKFQVKSSATGFFDNAEMQQYSFSIAPPFYNTFWFYLLMTALGVFVLMTIVKVREKNLKKEEHQKKEQIEFRFETLKSQVNPHFLFNSFNTLIAVIEEDQDTAVEYVERLSDFYRNILVYREQNVITVEEELKMTKLYHYLQTKRYKNNFKIDINVDFQSMQMYIPPMTLQLLMENAVKHNIISKEKPLTIKIYNEDNFLVVENNLQLKSKLEPSTGMGLSNIIHRYHLLSDRDVNIIKTDNYFIVKVPLLSSKK